MEQLAQVIASLGLGGVGPEEEGKMLALLRNIVMQHEVGEQGLQAQGVEAGHLPVSVDQAETAEQAEVKGWHHHDRLPFSSFGSSDGRVVSSGNMCMTSRKSSKPSIGDASDHLQLATIVLNALTLPYHSLFYHYPFASYREMIEQHQPTSLTIGVNHLLASYHLKVPPIWCHQYNSIVKGQHCCPFTSHLNPISTNIK